MSLRIPHFVATLCLLAFTVGSQQPIAGADPTPKTLTVLTEGVIPQVATGGGSFFMDFQFVNASDGAASVTLAFFDSDGLPMSVPYFQDGIEKLGTSISDTIAPGGIEFARTKLNSEAVQIGYATVSNFPFYAVEVQATFNQVVTDRPLFSAFIPQDTRTKDSFFLPSVNTAGRTSSMAVVSLDSQNVLYIARNRNGVEICSAGRPFQEGEHHAFIIPQLLPCLAGIDGVIQVIGQEEGKVYGVGITAQDDGAFATQPVVNIPQPLLL